MTSQGISVKIVEANASAANLSFSFETVNVYSRVLRMGGPFQFYKGNVGMLADIRRLDKNQFVVRKFNFSDDAFQLAWGTTHIKFIEEPMLEMGVETSMLWDLDAKRKVARFDFEPRFHIPRSEKRILFVSDTEGFKLPFYLFDKRPNRSAEDLAIFSALHHYASCGVQIEEKEEQSVAGKKTLLYLAETFYNRGVPAYISEREMGVMADFLTLKGDERDHYEGLVTGNNGELFNDILSGLYSSSPFRNEEEGARLFDATPTALETYIKNGSIYLTELIAVGVDNFIEAVNKSGKEVHIEIDTMGEQIKEVEVVGERLQITANTHSDVRVDYESMLDTNNLIVVF